MRFKKLRISVAVTLVVFILLVGSILAFGLSKSQQDLNAIPKNTQIIINTPPVNTAPTVSQPSQTDTNTVSSSPSLSNPQPTQSPVMQPQVMNPRVRTRAS